MDFNSIIHSAANAFFPPRCAFCGKVRILEDGVCTDCAKSLPLVSQPVCKNCGVGKDLCECKKHEHYYDAVCAPFYYTGVVKNGIDRLKFRGKTEVAEHFGDCMARFAEKIYGDVHFDFITNVPMTYSSFKKRGYNQSALLARRVSEKLNVQYDSCVLAKIYDSGVQHRLSFGTRRGNVAGVFDVLDGEKVKGKTILLVDDVLTTGATIDECAKMLYLEGAAAVMCLTLAVAVPRKKQ